MKLPDEPPAWFVVLFIALLVGALLCVGYYGIQLANFILDGLGRIVAS